MVSSIRTTRIGIAALALFSAVAASVLMAAMLWTGTAQAQEATTPIVGDMAGMHHTLSEGCDNPSDPRGGVCTTKFEGYIEGTPIANPDKEGEDAGFNATLTTDYTAAGPGTDGYEYYAPTTGQATLTDVSGDRLDIDIEGTIYGIADDTTGYRVFYGTFTVTGGTGIYADATGDGGFSERRCCDFFNARIDGMLGGVAEGPAPDPNACTIRGTDGDDVLTGTAGRDVICGMGGSDTVRAMGGNDLVRGGNGEDTVRGNRGNDTIGGNDGADDLYGGYGRDTVRGNAGRDEVHGGPGDDTVKD
jgi:Ca2+-binding RTX toxin-like protein